jgi:hypothetical protein
VRTRFYAFWRASAPRANARRSTRGPGTRALRASTRARAPRRRAPRPAPLRSTRSRPERDARVTRVDPGLFDQAIRWPRGAPARGASPPAAAAPAAAALDALPQPERARTNVAAQHVEAHGDRYDSILCGFADVKGLDLSQTRRIAAKLLEMVNEQYGDDGAFLKMVGKLHEMSVTDMSEDSFGIERLNSLSIDDTSHHEQEDVAYAHEIHLTVAEAKRIVDVAYKFCRQNSYSHMGQSHLLKMQDMLKMVGHLVFFSY